MYTFTSLRVYRLRAESFMKAHWTVHAHGLYNYPLALVTQHRANRHLQSCNIRLGTKIVRIT